MDKIFSDLEQNYPFVPSQMCFRSILRLIHTFSSKTIDKYNQMKYNNVCRKIWCRVIPKN